MGIGENIKNLRKNAGMTQEQLAERVGVARTTITQWECGWTSPRMGKVKQLASVFGTTNAAIVADTGNAGLSSAQIAAGMPAAVPLTTLSRVRAGTADDELSVNHPAEEQLVELPASLLAAHPHAQAVIVECDCMDRVMPRGMAAVFDPDLAPENGQIVIVEVDHQGEDRKPLLRRWYQGGNTLMLVADSHTTYDDILLPVDAAINVLGTVFHTQSVGLL